MLQSYTFFLLEQKKCKIMQKKIGDVKKKK